MPIKNLHYVVYDLETTGRDPLTCEPIEIAAKIYHGRSLEAIPEATFSMLCKPSADVIVEQEALDVNKITREQLEQASPISIVFPKFVEFVSKYNTEAGSKWGAPIAAGHNIVNYDNVIIKRMLEKFGKKKSDTVLFNNMFSVDLMNLSYWWFHNDKGLPSYKLDSLREYFGIDKSGAHRALKDVEDCGAIIMRFLKFNRELAQLYLPKIKGAFRKGKEITV